MKVFIQVAAVCLLASVAFAAKGPVANPVCDALCPDDFPIKDNWHLPYTNDCTKFCHCANDGNWEKDCPAGLHFNAKLQVCDWPNVAGCEENGSNPDPPASTTPETHTPGPVPDGCDDQTCSAEECKEWAHNGDCQKYCDCDHGTITVKECAEGLHFNPATGDCDWPENANCEIKPPQNGCEHVTCNEHDCFKSENTIDCNAYCDCDHGNVTVGHCAEGLHFNPETGACDFPWNAGCEESKPPTSSTTTTSTEGSGQPSGECDNICPNVWPIVENNHLYPGDCTKFCHCANDGNWLKDCPEGLHFNAKLQVCDWPEVAGCIVTRKF